MLESEFTGAGIRVAVLDTGFDEDHQRLHRARGYKEALCDHQLGRRYSRPRHALHRHGLRSAPAFRPAPATAWPMRRRSTPERCSATTDSAPIVRSSPGMDWAVEQGCQIISMSLGAATQIGDSPSDDYEQIGQVCLDAGTLVIAAAGNESARPHRISPVGSPANASTIMAVGGCRQRSLAPSRLLLRRSQCGPEGRPRGARCRRAFVASRQRLRRGGTARAWRRRTSRASRP